MYEGPIKAADYAETGKSPVLRQLRWTELVARIAATRGVREASAGDAGPGHASFAAFHTSHDDEEGKRPINQDVLSHGKITRLIRDETANDADHGDRETE